MNTTNQSIQAEKIAAEAAGEALVQMAYASTPEKFHHHLVILSQNKRVGPKNSNVWASVKAPYMTVAGRVAMMRDEHAATGVRVDIDSEIIEFADHWVCKCIVTSSIHGRSTEYSEIRFGGAGVDATSPVENGSTSALGRALGAFGYGLFGAGLASADEVIAAIAQDASPPIANPVETIPLSSEKEVDHANIAAGYEDRRKELCLRLNEVAESRGLTQTLQVTRELVKTQDTPVTVEQLEGLMEKFETVEVYHIPSTTETGKVYEVVVNDNGKPQCTCQGYRYKLKCRHVNSVAVAA